MKPALILILLQSVSFLCHAQTFVNGDLEGTPGLSAPDTDILGWEFVPFTDPISEATGLEQATPDLCDATTEDFAGPLGANPYSGLTMLTALHGGSSFGVPIWHEGIMQSVSGLTVGQEYTIVFHQAVIKQVNNLENTGAWRLYAEEVLVGTSETSTSTLEYDDMNVNWELRSISFTATSDTHLLKFLPWDDDGDIQNSQSNLNGGLRMGIDCIAFAIEGINEIPPIGPLCQDSEPILVFPESLTGVWSGVGIIDSATGLFDPNLAGPGTHRILFTQENGCSGIINSTDITVLDADGVGFNLEETVCADSAPLLLSDFLPEGAEGVWSGEGVEDGFFNPSGLNGTHDLIFTSEDSEEVCSSGGELSIVILAPSNAGVSSDVSVCANDDIIDLFTELNGTPEEGGFWSPSTSLGDGLFDPSSDAFITYVYTLTNSDGCEESTASVTVNNLSLTTDLIISGPSSICSDSNPVSYTVNAEGGQWLGENIDSDGIFVPNGNGLYVINYILDENGCDYSASETIQVQALPSVVLGENRTICAESQFILSVSTENVTSLNWSNGGTGASIMVEADEEMIGEILSYSVIGSNSCGTSFDEINLEIVECGNDYVVYVPNAFTPDQNGINEVFKPVANGLAPAEYRLLIFNRWGELIFESIDIELGWTGNSQFGDYYVPDGIYTWLIEYRVDNSSLKEKLTGHVTVMR